MAASVTLTPYSVGSSIDQKTIDYYFSLVVNAGTYATPGIPVSFSGLVAAPGSPLEIRIFSVADPGVAGLFVYHYAPDADDQNGGTFQIFTGAAAQAALTELSNGAVPAGVTGDTIRMIAKFRRG